MTRLPCKRLLILILVLLSATLQMNWVLSDEKDSSSTIAIQFHEALVSGDDELALSLTSDEVSLTFHDAQSVTPFSGQFYSKTGLRRFFAVRNETLANQVFELREVIATNDTIAIRGTLSGHVIATGGRYSLESIALISVEEAGISRVDQYLDTATLHDAFKEPNFYRGRAWFGTCVGCHGNSGEGNFAMNGPNITGQRYDYILRQMRNYATGLRGGVDDYYGWQMNGRVNALPGDRAHRDVAYFVSELETIVPEPTIQADVDAGRKIYQTCVACHGSRGEGNRQVGSPALSTLNDWYLVRQIELYRTGVRGAHPDDAFGQTMRAIAVNSLKDSDDIRNVAAYIARLKP